MKPKQKTRKEWKKSSNLAPIMQITNMFLFFLFFMFFLLFSPLFIFLFCKSFYILSSMGVC